MQGSTVEKRVISTFFDGITKEEIGILFTSVWSLFVYLDIL